MALVCEASPDSEIRKSAICRIIDVLVIDESSGPSLNGILSTLKSDVR